MCSFSLPCPQVAAAVAAGAVGAIGIGQPGRLVRQGQEQTPLACLNVALTKNTLKVDVCALSTDVAYNRCVLQVTLIWQAFVRRVCVVVRESEGEETQRAMYKHGSPSLSRVPHVLFEPNPAGASCVTLVNALALLRCRFVV